MQAHGAAGRVGYEYMGKVNFVHNQKRAVPVLDMSSLREATGPPAGTVGDEHYTVLVTRSGHSFTKRLASKEDDPELVAALSAVQFPAHQGQQQAPQQAQRTAALQSNRRLAQAAIPNNVGIASTDLGCDGCSGYDNRVQVTNTVQFPFSAVGELTGQLGTSNRGLECTGTLIGPKHVVTAAHCVYDINDSHQYVASINFAPGQNGNAQPYGQLEWSSVRVLSQFTSQASYTPTAMDYDFALITLKDSGASAGYMGMDYGNGGTVTLNLTTAGYPGEKPPGTMWESLCANINIDYTGNQGVFNEIDQCQGNRCANILQHTCLSSNGQSGSSMWDNSQRIRAILTGKVSTSDNQDINVGTKINAFVYNTLAQWYNEDLAAAGSNNTLPAAPSGPQPPPANTNPKTFLGVRLEWNNPVFVAIVVALCCVGLAIAAGLLCCLNRACTRRRAATKVYYGQDVRRTSRQRQQRQQQYMTNGGGAVTNGGGSYPSHYAGGREHAVVYDERSGQFVVNGRPYGAYQFDAQRGYYPTHG
ncbi:probable glutamyl endopeptidase [Coccomyxa sp. Obi]|nr:probable glutamyl endopeptidase [Coccomyxa sp. Obi]